MTIIEVNREKKLDKILCKNNNVLLYFTASWCGPCKAIKPFIECLSDDILVVMIDVDCFDSKSTVSSVPYFIGYKCGDEIGRVKCADKKAVSKLVNDIIC